MLNESMDLYDPSTPTSFCPSIAPSPHVYSQTPTFNWRNADTPIKTEKESVITDDFLERCIEDHCLRVPFVGQVEGYPLGLQDDDSESSTCFSSQYLPREAFETSSLTRLLSNPPLYPEEEQQDAGFGYQSIPMEYASQSARQDLHPLEMCEDSDAVSTTSFRPRTRRSNNPSMPRLAVRPATRSSSRLQNLRDQGLGYQENYEIDQQRDHRESSVASTVIRRFSDLSLMSAASSPLVQTSSVTLSTPATAPFKTTATTSSSVPSALYFPPTASALHQKRRKALKQELRVPRPKNCFMLYRSKVLPMIMAELGNINNKIISKIAAERWRAESEPVKTWYRDMAKFGKEEHARNNPGYKYAPLNKLRSMAATALSHLTQSQHSSKKVTGTATHDSEKLDADGNNSGSDEDYVDGSSSTRRRLARQHQQRHQPATRSGLRSQVSKRRNSNLGSEIPSPSQNKKPRDSVDSHVGYPPMNFSTDSFPSLASAETIGLSLFAQQYQHYETAYRPHPLVDPSRPLPAFPYGASSVTTTSAMTPSIYSLAGDKNASETTLVDPIDHWTTHRYHETPSYFDHVNLSPASTTLLSSHSVVQTSKLTAAGSLMTPSKLMMIDPKVLMEKELPPQPQEMTARNNIFYATNKSSSHAFVHNTNDPNSILTQMFLDYNPSFQHNTQHHQQQQHHRQHYQRHQHQLSTTSSCSTTATTFKPTESSFFAIEEPKVSNVGVGMMNVGAPASNRAQKQEQVHVQQQQQQQQQQRQHTHEQNPFQQAFQQHTQHQQHQHAFHKHVQQQHQQHQQQFQQLLQQQPQLQRGWFLRKPTGPAELVSLTSVAAQGQPMLVSDFFSSSSLFK